MIMGIDPGLNGGIAIISKYDGVIVEPMPKKDETNEIDLEELSRLLKDFSLDIKMAYLEKVHAMPKQGVSSTFKFGKGFGAVEALLIAHKIPYRLITPQAWQKIMHKGESRAQGPKQRSLRVAKRLFPRVNFLKSERSRVDHDGLIDAILIAEYGRVKYNEF